MKPRNDILDNFALFNENVRLKARLRDKQYGRIARIRSLEWEIGNLKSKLKYRDKVIKKLRASLLPSPELPPPD